MAFIGLQINSEIARLFRNIDIPGERVPENEYHITILCFEENWPLKEIAKAMECAYEIVSNFDPFHIKIDKISCFPKREDNPVPVIAQVQSEELENLNSSLKKAFNKKNIDYLKTFKDFKPHITLAWAEDEIKDIKIEPKVEFFVHQVVLWGGDDGDDRLFITFPFKGIQKKKSAEAIERANVFYKFAKAL